ncbi:MAG: hypothetical protein A3C06_03080 [Candidatus Taylorbacteria bacterium RIFCSPHIGHO2_02_FULL_46_13]|uniref:GTPase Obg n=1 Tax=Candidatus Taylorbacteria bacterium RIFCSPHIGHO2_02_FULL_46_13 TaxID=1802312 RepID=A0A1G2MRP3_9BACT|nr:MAG: hypothetical protein A3C06_03080 [Candidatus Taylorbacteria bacterium RIFCSPHIGHO2_02_FULL_46_13]
MALIDEIKIHITAGRGGDGVVRWLQEKNKDHGGPSGGDGGKGGSVYARAIRDIAALARYRSIKELRADDGEDGKADNMHGKSGKDLVFNVPTGSVITNHQTDEKFEVLKEGDTVLLLAGGGGGLGNSHFKGSVNRRPREFTTGKAGETADFTIELQLIADAGLIGLPNAGKSSLLNTLTHANAKIGSYAFTTLEPNLGVMNGYVLADIPGLIEGAAEGRGLGHRFLRHIRRTRVLLHCISLENGDFEKVYKVVRAELGKYDSGLLNKREVIVLTKTDLLEEKALKERIQVLSKKFGDVIAVSILDDASIKGFKEYLTRLFEGLMEASNES